MKKLAVLVFVFASLVASVIIAPVSAIGPWKAEEIGKNPNLILMGSGVVNDKGNAAGSNIWAWTETDQHWVTWKFLDPLDAKGVMNNAITATSLAQISQMIDTGYDNQWIYLSGDGGTNPYQYRFPDTTHALYLLGSHGMAWWFFFVSFGGMGAHGLPPNPAASAVATSIVAAFPSGLLWMINDIQQSK